MIYNYLTTTPALQLAAESLVFSSFYAWICSEVLRSNVAESVFEVYFDLLVSIGIIVSSLVWIATMIIAIVSHGWLAGLAIAGFVVLGSVFLRFTIIMGFLFPPISLWLWNAAAVFFCIRAWFER